MQRRTKGQKRNTNTNAKAGRAKQAIRNALGTTGEHATPAPTRRPRPEAR